jgi:arginine-tRNA-protein transferase
MSLYLNDQLVCGAVTDQLGDGLSAIYTYFDPDFADRSLGVFAVLKQLEYCLAKELPYLYMGYWIRDAAKMRYKTDYRPIELFINSRWIPMN